MSKQKYYLNRKGKLIYTVRSNDTDYLWGRVMTEKRHGRENCGVLEMFLELDAGYRVYSVCKDSLIYVHSSLHILYLKALEKQNMN